MTNQSTSAELQHPKMRERWDALREPAWEINQTIFRNNFLPRSRRPVLNCAIPLARAKILTDFTMPAGWSVHKSLVASVGFGAKLPEGLENWRYIPKIQAVSQLPQLKLLPREHRDLTRSPWFQSPSQGIMESVNARHLRYHYQLWQDLRPKTLRGVFTTLVYVTPQLGWSLAPHIRLNKAFNYFGALSRMAAPIQLFPAAYLYPDANLRGMEKAPAAIFADLLPNLGSSFPVMDEQTNPWGIITRLDGPDCYYGYPFRRVHNHFQDTQHINAMTGSMTLPNGQMVRARHSETVAYATLDPKLKETLKMDRMVFHDAYCLDRGVITHDGLPFMLPVEMQAAVFAVILTAWELEMDKPGDLSSYTLRTRHAAIRGYNFYQRQEPYFSNFMRLVNELGREPNFETYPLASHLTYSWLGGNLMLANQQTEPERVQGIEFMRSYNLQQLDWMMGVINLCNTVEFRKSGEIEDLLDLDGVAFHQMQPQLRHDMHLFPRPLRRASFWPDFDQRLLAFDQRQRLVGLPRPHEH